MRRRPSQRSQVNVGLRLPRMLVNRMKRACSQFLAAAHGFDHLVGNANCLLILFILFILFGLFGLFGEQRGEDECLEHARDDTSWSRILRVARGRGILLHSE